MLQIAPMLIGLGIAIAIAVPTGDVRAAQPAEVARSFDVEVARANQAMAADPVLALEAATRAARIAGRTGNDGARLARARWLQAEAMLRSGRPADAERAIDQALGLIDGRDDLGLLRGDLLLTRGGIHAELGRVAPALDDYQRAYRQFVAAGELRKRSVTLAALGSLHRQGADFSSALKYFSQALDTFEGDPVLTVTLSNSRGNLLLDMARPREAVAQFERALAYADRLDNPDWKARILGNLARAQLAAGDLVGAERSIAAGLALTSEYPSPRASAELDFTRARLAAQRGDFGQAASLVDRSFDGIDLTTTTMAQRDHHRVAHMAYAGSGRASDALAHLEALRRLDEQATEIATSTRAALISARFDFANQELRIANLKAEELRRNVAFERSRTRFQQVIFVSIGLATLIVLALLAYNLVTVRRSRNRVRAANEQLEATNVRLEKALAAKTEFLATTSHEIRTPLNGILGMTQVMLSDGALTGKLKDRIGIVHGAGLTMKALVDDILDVAKMETGHLSISLEATDLPATLREVTRMWEEQAHSKGLAFVLDVSHAPRWVETDPGRLRQIVFNLLANALKFTESGGITMRVFSRDADNDDDGRLLIAVRDTGIGIPVEKQEDIFESFKQVDAGTTRRFGGTGLGLAICRNLARALGGDILVNSRPGEGSTFTVDMPLRAVEGSERDEDPLTTGALLILDGNPINRSMLRTLLESRAGRVRFAATTAEAVTALGEGTIGYVLIDDATVRGGDADPIALVGKVASAAAAAGAVSAVLWKTPSEEDTRRLRETALDHVIVKPVAGAMIGNVLFGDDRKPPLVSQAA